MRCRNKEVQNLSNFGGATSSFFTYRSCIIPRMPSWLYDFESSSRYKCLGNGHAARWWLFTLFPFRFGKVFFYDCISRKCFGQLIVISISMRMWYVFEAEVTKLTLHRARRWKSTVNKCVTRWRLGKQPGAHDRVRAPLRVHTVIRMHSANCTLL